MKRCNSANFALLALTFVMVQFGDLKAQQSKNVLNINIQTNFYLTNDEYRNHNASFSAFNPGVEILYKWELSEKLSVLTGANYIYSTWNYTIGVKFFYEKVAHELFIPVLLETKLNKRIYLTTGFYSGWLVKGKLLYKDVIGNVNWIDVTQNSDYSSSPKFSADFFLGTSYAQALNNKSSIDFSPFVKFKIADNWMGEVRSKVSFGLKLNYVFDL